VRKGQSKAAFTRFGAVLRKVRGSWVLDFEMAGLRRFYLGHPLCHDVGGPRGPVQPFVEQGERRVLIATAN